MDVVRRRAGLWPVALAALLMALAWSVVRLAWLSDDAFITFRSVENLFDGYGPNWNVNQRVQTYTHPLWFLLLAGLRGLLGHHVYGATIAVGMVLSATTVFLLWRLARDVAAMTVVLALLLSSRTWACYATSGLETSLVYVLVTALALAHRDLDPDHRLRRVSLIAGLLAITRFDSLVLAGPCVLANAIGRPRGLMLRAVAVGMLPLVVWSAFAIVYYGSPFPITAYAKAFCHGVPASELLTQGLRYVYRTATDDPVTLAGLVLGVGLGLRQRGLRSLAVGALGSAFYTVKVGGDYMLGRFFLPAFSLSMAIVAMSSLWRSGRVATCTTLAALALAFAPGVPESASLPPATRIHLAIPEDGILDEQRWAYWTNGMLSPARLPVGEPGAIGRMLPPRQSTRQIVAVAGAVGLVGFGLGSQVHLADPWLCDPLLMRLPVVDPDYWRIGHFFRRFPRGFLESVASGDNQIADPSLARVFDAVQSIVSDPIFSAHRWHNIWLDWTGGLRADIERYVAADYRDPPRESLSIAALSQPVPAPGFWFYAPAARSAQSGGLEVRLQAPVEARRIVVLATADAPYSIRLRRNGETVHSKNLRIAGLPLAGMQPHVVEVPPGTGAIDAIWIDASPPVEVPAAACVAQVIVEPID